MMEKNSIWVFCENGPQGVREVSYELLGAAARLAKNAGTRVVAVALGVGAPAEELCARGADEVLLVEDAALDAPEEMRYTEEICALARGVFAGHLPAGRNDVWPQPRPARGGAALHGLTADCTQLEIDKETGLLLQTRPAFGGNLFATILCPEARPQMATVRPKVFPMPEADRTRSVRVERRRAASKPSAVELLSLRGGEAGVNLADYDVLVCVGQGIGGAENIARAEKLAEKLGGTLAASRPMVDAGILPYARQVGRRANLWRRSCIWRWACPGPSSIWPGSTPKCWPRSTPTQKRPSSSAPTTASCRTAARFWKKRWRRWGEKRRPDRRVS